MPDERAASPRCAKAARLKTENHNSITKEAILSLLAYNMKGVLI